MEVPVTCKGEEYQLPRALLSKIGLISALQSPDDSFIPMDLDCKLSNLKLIVEWLEHHEDTEKYPRGIVTSEDPMEDDRLEPVCGWDREFIDKMGPATFYSLAVDVIDLEIVGMTTMVCREIAYQMIHSGHRENMSLMLDEVTKNLKTVTVSDL